ncbi:DUF5316 domain-containing protein [Brevibacillus brevis]|uniref:DUF5316 domain-containing protein n=1 Tax=Brevibacillus brevis TaxID=1393 RepID=UPI001C8DAAEC|nr:DUF5316 domain-containing protein [Brevibacillus brevis]MBY0085791.1 hypothetical protein [Brevibacillus brevis]
MIKALLIGIGLIGLIIGYAFLEGNGFETLMTVSGYTGFGLLLISMFIFGSLLGVDRITMATPDVKRTFVVDENNEEMEKVVKKEQKLAMLTFLAAIPSVIVWIFLYIMI